MPKTAAYVLPAVLTTRQEDLLRWTEQSGSKVAGGDTGSVSKTESGIIALYPDGSPRTLQRQVPTNEPGGNLSLSVEWGPPTTAASKPASLGVGMRDPARALKMADGSWYVGAGSGFGGTGPKSNNKTGLPNSGTGCLAWFKATNSTLQELEYVGCLLENNHTTGYINPKTVAWNETDRVAGRKQRSVLGVAHCFVENKKKVICKDRLGTNRRKLMCRDSHITKNLLIGNGFQFYRSSIHLCSIEST